MHPVWNVKKRRKSAAKKLLVKDALKVTATAIKIGFRTKEEERGNQGNDIILHRKKTSI
ncbi:23304_t:CDS:2 [Entrophospora sp. SA101]|nr:23304_t:CDS:2 [Entrophospora sp. SA101]